ncbi:uncharacterized protein LOC130895262 isoform X2 [Diorhabda carinulata]|uniref:uncharacterized protein LOC130895262 isoform X2 n=1 Tax=Diorhabda carinulata TaxID=1163345 RepID=UPI0025A215DE|nr:uncharacterized protein LOC130895262 isoform X2 [Diorhabda carinulata]
MTNGRGAGMASFMTKKKKYKFQVEICLEELLEVPFVSAVLFAKLRLLDGGNFQDHSSRQEVQDHKVHWGANFTFPCKMMANASTGIMERCILRISIRKEYKGGRSFTKLGFVDLNLAEYAGAGLIHKKALLEGYDARHRQDNSMLKFKIELNMISGDILFKAPSPSLKHKQVNVEETNAEQRPDEFSSGSLAGSIASGSSGFGSLPKKRPALLSSELVIGQTLTENNAPVSVSTDHVNDNHPISSILSHSDQEPQETAALCEHGHSRNSSNTSQLSKASGYSSIQSHSHSRQSSSGDSGHIRNLQSRSVRAFRCSSADTNLKSNRKMNIPNTILSINNENNRPQPLITSTPNNKNQPESDASSLYGTPPATYQSQCSNDEYKTPEVSFDNKSEVFSSNFNELQKSSSTSVVERIKNEMLTSDELEYRKSDNTADRRRNDRTGANLRSKSDFEIPKMPVRLPEKNFSSKFFNSDSLFSFLTPRPKRKSVCENDGAFKVPVVKYLPEVRSTTSMGSLRSGNSNNDERLCVRNVERNPSAGSLVISETGSLDRAKAAYERRKKNQCQDTDAVGIPGRVEKTRVNVEDLVEDLLKNTNLEQPDDSAETSGLQLFIAKDGTAALGNHEVKSQMSAGVQVFKQVVMDNR